MTSDRGPERPAAEEHPQKQGGESLLTVIVAFAANVLIAVAKSAAALITGSASMVAEAAHSWADSGNEIFLLIAEKKAERQADEAHPLGYGREAYVWSMFAAFGLFTAGAVVSIWHGIQQLTAGGEAEADYRIAYIVLAVSFVLEGTSFTQAVRQTRGESRRLGLRPLRFLTLTSNPTLRAVVAEDSAALIGILFAAGGIGLHELTGDARYDAAGSILVGLLLGVIALVLIDRNRDFLTGQAVAPEVRERVLGDLIARDDIARITYLHLEFVGPGAVFLVAAVDLTGDEPESHVASALRRIETELTADDLVQSAVLTLSAPEDTPIAGS